jgi:hypothetical protein
MPDGFEEKLHELRGKPEHTFLIYAFTEKLFLYTKMCFVNRKGGKTLNLWTHSVLAPKEDEVFLEDLVGRLLHSVSSYAIFEYTAEESVPDAIMFATEDFTAKVFYDKGARSEIIQIPSWYISEKEMFNLCGLFNITRNGKNTVDYLHKKSHELISSDASEHGYVAAIDDDGRLYAFPAVDLLTVPNEYFEKFHGFQATGARNKRQAESIDACMNRIVDLTIEKRISKLALPKNVDKETLKMASGKCLADLTQMSDLPVYLQNLFANLYYANAVLALQNLRGDKKDYSDDGIKKYFSNLSFVVTANDAIPEYVKILRSIKGKNEYDKIAKNIFYDLKYDVEGGKISKIHKFFLKFYKKPIIEEIADLYKYF